MNQNVESHLDQVFSEGAASLAKDMAGNVYSYTLDSMGYTVKQEDHGKTGRCRVLGIHYSKSLDCNVYHLLDIDTDVEFHPCQFEVRLEEVKE